MTEKRFEYKNHKVYDNLTGETHSSNMVSVNVLNELHEENQLLKQRLAEQNDVEWLRNNTVWQVMPSSHRTYTSTTYYRRNDE